MAIGYARFGNNEDEIRHAREAVRLEPHDSNGYVCLAGALARDKADLEKARAAANDGVRLAPHSVDAHMALAFVADRSGDRDTAEVALRQVLAIDPENSAAHNDLARLRLSSSRRAFDPAALADAAGGFATAVRTNPAGQTSRLNLDLVIRLFLQRTSYLIFCDAWICARVGAHSASSGARLLPVAVLALPIAYALRFLYRVGPNMRAHVARELRLDRRVSLPAALMAIASILIIAGSASSQSQRTALASGAALTAFAGRLLLYQQIRVIGARARREALQPVIGSTTLWILAAALALTAGLLVLAYTGPTGGHQSELVAAGIAAALLVAVGGAARRRRR